MLTKQDKLILFGAACAKARIKGAEIPEQAKELFKRFYTDEGPISEEDISAGLREVILAIHYVTPGGYTLLDLIEEMEFRTE